MSSLHNILSAGLLVLAACGFEPLHGKSEGGEATARLLSQIEVAPIADRLGQLVRTELTNRLSPRPAPSPIFIVHVTLAESGQNLAVRRDSSATRANLIIDANFTLSEVSGGKQLLVGGTRSVNGYDILMSDFATLAARKDARRRGARDIADAIVDRLSIHMAQRTGRALAPARR